MEKQVTALHLISGSGSGKGLTERAQVIVSQEAPELLRRGLIRYAPRRHVGYALTRKGRIAVTPQGDAR